MSENRFQITIAAVDKATATVRRINKSVGGMVRPMSNVMRSTKALGNEVWANPIVKGVRKVGNAAWWAGSKVTSLFSPMTSLAGVGTIAGVAALAESWGRAGVQLSNSSKRIGMNIGDLQRYRGAAIAAGVSADDMTSSLVGLGDTLQDAVSGRNQTALFLLKRLHVDLKKDASGAIDVGQAFLDIADGIAKIPIPSTQALVARHFGLEGMLPAMRNGSKGVKERMELADRMGANDKEAAAANDRLGESFNKLELSIMGVENRLAKGWFIKDLTKSLDDLAEVVAGKMSLSEAYKHRWADLTSSKEEPPQNKLSRLVTGKITPAMPTFVPALASNLRQRGHNQAVDGQKAPPLGLRNNNPGNLVYARQSGATLGERGFAAFATPQIGLTAMARQLQIYGGRGISTINDIINTWAPAKAGNNVPAYISDVARQTGFDPNNRLDLNDTKTLSSLIPAMIRHEQAGKMPFTAEDIGLAVADALSKNPPTALVKLEHGGLGPSGGGKTNSDGHPVKYSQPDGPYGPTRIAYSMPGVP